MLASLGSLHNQDLWPAIWPSRPNSRSKDEVPDIVPKSREATCRLRPFWCACWRNFWTMSGAPRLASNLTLDVKHQVKGNDSVTRSGRQSIVWDSFGRRADVILGRYPVPRPLTMKLTLKVKCQQIKGHGCVSFPGRLAVVVSWDNFDMCADVIWGRFPVRRPLTLNRIDIEGRIPAQMSWLCKLPREASNRLRRFWYAC